MQEHGLVVTQVQIVRNVQINRGLILIKFVKRLEYRGANIFGKTVTRS
jgi:hypothetical protein